MANRQTIDVIISLGHESWQRIRDAVIRAADAGVTAIEAEQAMRSLTVRCSGLSTVEIIPDDAIAHLNALAEAHAQPTACHRCLYHSSSPLLACAVHPLGRPGEVCGDWEDGETDGAERWRFDGQQRALNAECNAAEHVTAGLAIRMDQAESDRFIAQQRENEAAWMESERRREAEAAPLYPQQNEAYYEAEVVRSGQQCGVRYGYWQAPDGTRHYPTNSPAHEPDAGDRASA